MRVLMITSEWPTPAHPEWAPFIVEQVENLREAGVEVTVFPFRGNRNPRNYFSAWRNLRHKYRLDQFDLIHAQFGQSGLIAELAPVPMVVTFHGSDLQGIVSENGKYRYAGTLLRFASQYVAYRAKEIIVVSQHLATHLPYDMAFRVIPCGIDLDLFHPFSKVNARRQLGLSFDKKLVLFAADPGRIVKRYHLAKEVISIVSEQMAVELLVVNGVSHTKMPKYMNAADVLLLTSKHEGSPTVVKEALACNVPVVSVDVGDVRQRLQGVSGCTVCDDDDAQTIAAALCQVLASGRRIEGRKAVSHLDLRHTTEQIIDVYHKALATS